MAVYGATPDDPYGWRAIAQGRTAEDPLGWGQIARNQIPDFGGLPPELLYALAGDVMPEDIMAGGGGGMGQPAPVDPMEQYLSVYGADYATPALALGQAIGVENQRDYYRPDDYRAIEKTLADRAIKAAQFGYNAMEDQRNFELDQAQFGLAQQKFGLARDAADRQAFESAAEYGSPENDLMFLRTMGVEPEDLLAELETDPEGTYENLGTTLNLTDDSGVPNWRTQPNINRLMGLINLAQQSQGQMAQAQAEQLPQIDEGQRWKGLDQGQRAKELYYQLVEPNKEVAFSPSGTEYTGKNAYQRMMEVSARGQQRRTIPGMQQKPKSASQTSGTKQEGKKQKGVTGGWRGAFESFLSPSEYNKKYGKNARTLGDWFFGRD